MFALDFNRNAAGSAAQAGGTSKAKKGEVALANKDGRRGWEKHGTEGCDVKLNKFCSFDRNLRRGAEWR